MEPPSSEARSVFASRRPYCNPRVLKRRPLDPGPPHPSRRPPAGGRPLTWGADLLTLLLGVEPVLVAAAAPVPEPRAAPGLRVVVPLQHELPARPFFLGQLAYVFKGEGEKASSEPRPPAAVTAGCWGRNKGEGPAPQTLPASGLAVTRGVATAQSVLSSRHDRTRTGPDELRWEPQGRVSRVPGPRGRTDLRSRPAPGPAPLSPHRGSQVSRRGASHSLAR